MSVPGLWSIIKRSTKVAPKRRVYEVPGPSQPGAQTMDAWAKRIATYFIKYNYSIVGTGEVIVFEGTYQASKVRGKSRARRGGPQGVRTSPCALVARPPSPAEPGLRADRLHRRLSVGRGAGAADAVPRGDWATLGCKAPAPPQGQRTVGMGCEGGGG